MPAFKRVGNRFIEDHGDFIKMIQVYFQRIGENEKTFTIDFAVFIPSLFKMFSNICLEPKNMYALNDVFNCNINDLLRDSNEKRKIKYWDIPCNETLFDQISKLVSDKLLPFSNTIKSLSDLNTIIDNSTLPFKNFADTPLFILGLKLMLKKHDDFDALADKLIKTDREYCERMGLKKILELRTAPTTASNL